MSAQRTGVGDPLVADARGAADQRDHEEIQLEAVRRRLGLDANAGLAVGTSPVVG
jgi:hypothetical protein